MSDPGVSDASIFLSHASEDKDAIARPLAEELQRRGANVWFDEFSLVTGSSLRREIDRGLALARFGVVILSVRFFEKEWTQRELDALTARETAGTRGVILPVWHEIDRATVARFSPTLADRKAVLSTLGIEAVADDILNAIKRSSEGMSPAIFRSRPPRDPLDHDPSTAARTGYRFGGYAPRYTWHPDVHRVWGNSKLAFLRMSFDDPFRRTRVLKGISHVLAKCGVRSWQVDEIFGPGDIFVRVWLPLTVATSELSDHFASELIRYGLKAFQWFDVTDVLRHWIWQAPTGRGLRRPTREIVEKGIPDAEIEAIQEGTIDVRTADFFVHENVIATFGSSPGIRFYIEVAAQEPIDRAAEECLGDEIAAIVDEATGVDEPSLYRGRASGSYLIVGKATSDQFTRLSVDLAEPLGNLGDKYGSRSQTYLATGATAYEIDELARRA
jgi:hypothetical protein